MANFNSPEAKLARRTDKWLSNDFKRDFNRYNELKKFDKYKRASEGAKHTVETVQCLINGLDGLFKAFINYKYVKGMTDEETQARFAYTGMPYSWLTQRALAAFGKLAVEAGLMNGGDDESTQS